MLRFYVVFYNDCFHSSSHFPSWNFFVLFMRCFWWFLRILVEGKMKKVKCSVTKYRSSLSSVFVGNRLTNWRINGVWNHEKHGFLLQKNKKKAKTMGHMSRFQLWCTKSEICLLLREKARTKEVGKSVMITILLF